ncbi:MULTISPECIES: hypothetical protein [Leptospira]|uniref:hypothetical protein n=1 Tax=Leptospira TaxID=171 RepID=UPI0002B986C0|nr:hypothetical protein [Leptospira interrogans]MCL8268512.1 hypothetical protein [Leptospira weilii]EMN52465.1 hypothetical protein LEP1GSC089_0989 [Leptospira interrogans serovar Autumnalis str. LP101]EMN81327.1 hypothetical protein LEP1GSC106_2569 [Leptospira interrogans serovar Grippotyphosa str. UI 12764]EMN98968.1 hypothetical protein LEP1GSC112_0253 [Leptospira interrogans serovar Pomona str. UT364]EMO92215.1 hypothetical protein LEP1GSC109_0983 [Leptospira interrogans str. UI 13372]
MNKSTRKPKDNRKSKLEKEMKKLSIQLKNKEIKPMEFAENFPVKVDRYSHADVVQTVIAKYTKEYGEEESIKMLSSSDASARVVKLFVIEYLSNLMDGFEALKNIRGGKKAFGLLYQRAIDESRRVYPWLDKYYQN